MSNLERLVLCANASSSSETLKVTVYHEEPPPVVPIALGLLLLLGIAALIARAERKEKE